MALREQTQRLLSEEDVTADNVEEMYGIQGVTLPDITAKDVAMFGAEMLPGVGEALALKRTSDALDEKDYVGAGIEATAGLLGLIPGVGDAAGKALRATTRKLRKDAKLEIDNPGFDEVYQETYAETKQRASDKVKNKAIEAGQRDTYEANIGTAGGITGYANDVKFDPKELEDIPGAMGEEKFRSSDGYGKLELLEKSIAEKGYKPYNILIHVREDGQPFIVEGNHRLAEALKSGRETITADIRYLRGAEEKAGPLDPRNIFPDKMVDEAPVTTAAVQTTKSPLRVLFDKLPETERAALPAQPDENRLFGYHGTAKAREADEPFFDINFARKNDQFLGEGFYFTLDPEVASEYASIRGIKSERQIKGEKAKKILADENVIPSERGKRGSGTSVGVTPQGEYVTGGSMMKGQDIYGNPVSVGQYIGRFDLSNLEKPYVVRTEKQRKELKKIIPQLKKEGYDSILFADFKDRSKQIMVFPEHMDKINSEAINYAQGGAVPMKKQMELFADGGLEQDGGTKDPVSGNDVPPGAAQEEVRDDIPAQLSEGEFVFPADVVRYIGLEKLMRMRQEAKMGLKMMEEMGQMGNADEATIPDDLPFGITDLIIVDGSEGVDDDDKKEYNVGGIVNQPSNIQSGQTQIGMAPTPMSMPEITRPQQQDVPTYKPPETIPTFTEYMQPSAKQMAPQTITIVDVETGEERMITFIPGVTQIPQGFVRKEDYVPKEVVVPETPTTMVETARVREEDPTEKPDDGLGPGGGRIGMGGFSDGTGYKQNATIMGVSFNMGEGFMGGAAGVAATGLSLALGKPIPAEATATFTYDNQTYTVSGTEYNNLKESGYTGDLADKIVASLKTESGIARNTIEYDTTTSTFKDKKSGETFQDRDDDNDGIGDILNKAGQSIYSKVDKDDLVGSAQKMNQSEKDIASAFNDAQFEAFDFGDDDSSSSSGGGQSFGGFDDKNPDDPEAEGDFNAGGLAAKKKPKAKKMKRGGLASKK
jgi:hypothetical protein